VPLFSGQESGLRGRLLKYEIIFGLLVATMVVLLYLAEDHVLTKKHGVKLLFFYALFLGYVVYLSVI